MTTGNYESMIQSSLDVSAATAAQVVARYPLSRYASPALAFAAVGTDDSFACDAMTADQSLSKYVRRYSYEFNDGHAPERYEPPVGFPYGAAHESEVQYLLPARQYTISRCSHDAAALPGGHDEDLLDELRQGRQTVLSGVPEWKPFTGASHQTMLLDTPSPHVETTFANQHHCAFWESIH